MSSRQPVGGVLQMERPALEGNSPKWMTCIQVDNVDGACKSAEASSGNGLMQARSRF